MDIETKDGPPLGKVGLKFSHDPYSLGVVDIPDKYEERDNRKLLVLAAAEEPITIKDLADKLGFPPRTTLTYLNALLEEGQMECAEEAKGRSPALYQAVKTAFTDYSTYITDD